MTNVSFFQLERELVAVLSTDLPQIVTSDLYKNAILKWEGLSAKVLLLAEVESKTNSAVKTMLEEHSQEKRSVNGEYTLVRINVYNYYRKGSHRGFKKWL